MALNQYDITDPVELLATLTLNSLGDPFDPSTVRLKTLDPIGGLSTFIYGVDPEMIRGSEGQYSLIFYPEGAGVHVYRWEIENTGDEARSGAQESRFYVRRSAVLAASAGGSSGLDGGSA